MLNFIVLGLIPGTHLQITFSWLLLAVAGFMIYLELRYRQYHYHLETANNVPDASEDSPAEAKVPVQMAFALRTPRRYNVALVVGRRQYTLSVEL